MARVEDLAIAIHKLIVNDIPFYASRPDQLARVGATVASKVEALRAPTTQPGEIRHMCDGFPHSVSKLHVSCTIARRAEFESIIASWCAAHDSIETLDAVYNPESVLRKLFDALRVIDQGGSGSVIVELAGNLSIKYFYGRCVCYKL